MMKKPLREKFTGLTIRERKTMDDSPKSNRRSLLKSLLALASVAALPLSKRASAQKVPQAAVQYQDKPKGDQRCDNCAQWEPPNACKVVEGKIAPEGWCAIWVKKP
jgi:hypothetical protein